MLRGIIISPDRDLTAALSDAIREVGHVGITRTLDQYPDSLELGRVVRAHGPHLIFLGIESMEKAIHVVHDVEAKFNGVQIIAFHGNSEPQTLLEVMRAGIREFVAAPFPVESLRESLVRAAELIERKPPAIASTDQVFSFLPSKPGVGTSTVAMNASIALARMPDMNVLLSDFDLSSGMIKFMLKLDNAYCVTDAAEHAIDMDENLWPPLVTPIGRLDVLHAGRVDPAIRIEPERVRHLIDFMRRNYNALCFDLSGNLEKYSIEIMQESKRIFLVCTSELPSLHLAREKFQFLNRLDLTDRVSVLLNRCPKRPEISTADVEKLISVPVMMTFANDYPAVHKALSKGRPVDENSELGRQFNQFAHMMVERKAPQAAPADVKRRFIEYFSTSP